MIKAAEIRKVQSVGRVIEMASFAVDEAACPKKTGFSCIVPRRTHTRTDYTQVVLERKQWRLVPVVVVVGVFPTRLSLLVPSLP